MNQPLQVFKKLKEKHSQEDAEFSRMLNASVGSHFASTSKDVDIAWDMHLNSEFDFLFQSYQENGTKRTVKGITVTEQMYSKKAKKQENEAHFQNLEAILRAPLRMNFKELDEKIGRRIIQNKRFEGLESKIFALVNKDELKEFKNYEKEPQKCFLEWAKEFDRWEYAYDDDAQIFLWLRDRAMIIGYNLCCVLVNVMFFMSEWMYDEMLETFLVFQTSLEWVVNGEGSVVILRVLEILEVADRELRKKKKKQTDKSTNNLTRGKQVMTVNKESFVDGIVLALLTQIFRMELLWMYHGLPDLKDGLTGVIFELLDKEISACEDELTVVASDIAEMGADYMFGIFDAPSLMESAECVALDATVHRVWEQLWY